VRISQAILALAAEKLGKVTRFLVDGGRESLE
jgi:hypothetical protein